MEEFYERNTAYHDMTVSEDKIDHPQVRFLSCLVRPGGIYAEIGCGSGVVCRMVSENAFAHGFDVAPIAIRHAQERCVGLSASFACASADALPLKDNTVDGCYSFELFEHVWDPVAVVREMVRITKPGGFMLISTPNRLSLDLHLPKRRIVRCVETAVATARYLLDRMTRRAYINLYPDIDEEVYSDCDMICSIIPVNFVRIMERTGCSVDFWDTTYMCAHREGSNTTLDFQKNTARFLQRHFGDHILILARKCVTARSGLLPMVPDCLRSRGEISRASSGNAHV